jgi:hypothetical protein
MSSVTNLRGFVINEIYNRSNTVILSTCFPSLVFHKKFRITAYWKWEHVRAIILILSQTFLTLAKFILTSMIRVVSFFGFSFLFLFCTTFAASQLDIIYRVLDPSCFIQKKTSMIQISPLSRIISLWIIGTNFMLYTLLCFLYKRGYRVRKF